MFIDYCLGTMNTVELQEILKVLAHQNFHYGVFACNRLPTLNKSPCIAIANTDPDYKPGEHWCAFFISSDRYGEYFDSFGQPPAAEHLKFMKSNCKTWTYNKKIIQSNNSSICGNYCIMYLLFKICGYKMSHFLKIFNNNCDLNDTLLMHLYNEMIEKKYNFPKRKNILFTQTTIQQCKACSK